MNYAGFWHWTEPAFAVVPLAHIREKASGLHRDIKGETENLPVLHCKKANIDKLKQGGQWPYALT